MFEFGIVIIHRAANAGEGGIRDKLSLLNGFGCARKGY